MAAKTFKFEILTLIRQIMTDFIILKVFLSYELHFELVQVVYEH